MRAVVQRVRRASVTVDGRVVGEPSRPAAAITRGATRGARTAQSAGASLSGRPGASPAQRQVPNARHDRAGAACREGLRAGMSPGRVSGPGRSSAPQMMAPAAKMPAHHQNTVV